MTKTETKYETFSFSCSSSQVPFIIWVFIGFCLLFGRMENIYSKIPFSFPLFGGEILKDLILNSSFCCKCNTFQCEMRILDNFCSWIFVRIKFRDIFILWWTVAIFTSYNCSNVFNWCCIPVFLLHFVEAFHTFPLFLQILDFVIFDKHNCHTYQTLVIFCCAQS